MSLTDVRHPPLVFPQKYACAGGMMFFFDCPDCREALGKGLLEGSVEPIGGNVNALLQLIAQYKDPANIARMNTLERMSHNGTDMDNLYAELWKVRNQWLLNKKRRLQWDRRTK